MSEYEPQNLRQKNYCSTAVRFVFPYPCTLSASLAEVYNAQNLLYMSVALHGNTVSSIASPVSARQQKTRTHREETTNSPRVRQHAQTDAIRLSTHDALSSGTKLDVTTSSRGGNPLFRVIMKELGIPRLSVSFCGHTCHSWCWRRRKSVTLCGAPRHSRGARHRAYTTRHHARVQPQGRSAHGPREPGASCRKRAACCAA